MKEVQAEPQTATAVRSPEEFLTVAQAALLLGVSRNALYEAVNRGEIPGVLRVGRRIVVSRQKLLDGMTSGVGREM